MAAYFFLPLSVGFLRAKMNDTNNGSTSNTTIPFYHLSQNVLASVIMGTYGVYCIILYILLLWRCKHQPLKARGVPLMFVSLTTYTVTVFVSAIRFAIGREGL